MPSSPSSRDIAAVISASPEAPTALLRALAAPALRHVRGLTVEDLAAHPNLPKADAVALTGLEDGQGDHAATTGFLRRPDLTGDDLRLVATTLSTCSDNAVTHWLNAVAAHPVTPADLLAPLAAVMLERDATSVARLLLTHPRCGPEEAVQIIDAVTAELDPWARTATRLGCTTDWLRETIKAMRPDAAAAVLRRSGHPTTVALFASEHPGALTDPDTLAAVARTVILRDDLPGRNVVIRHPVGVVTEFVRRLGPVDLREQCAQALVSAGTTIDGEDPRHWSGLPTVPDSNTLTLTWGSLAARANRNPRTARELIGHLDDLVTGPCGPEALTVLLTLAETKAKFGELLGAVTAATTPNP